MKLIATLTLALLSCAGVYAQDSLQANNDALRAAVEGKKSPAEIKRLAVAVINGAKKDEASDNADTAKYAQGVMEYAGYALYSAAAAGPAATTLDMITALDSADPKSKYLTQDAYLLAANAAMGIQDAARASTFARKSLTAPKGAKPEAATANAHYVIGVVAATKNDFATAAKELKIAVPGLKGNPQMEGPAYFYLGSAEYRVGRQAMDRIGADQGIKDVLMSAQISGPYQQQALAAAKQMKAELGEK